MRRLAAATCPLSTDVWSADGELLRVTLAPDDQYPACGRRCADFADICRCLSAERGSLVLLARRVSIRLRWLGPRVRDVSRRARQGGSTLTMQLARLMYRLNTRTPAGKLRQIGAALWLEARYSKRELLEAYLNVVPFGGNIQGVGAASRIYFGKVRGSRDAWRSADARRHSAASGEPRRPRRRRKPACCARAARLGHLWLAQPWRIHRTDRRQLDLPIVARRKFAMPQQAPHFVDALLAIRAGRGTDASTRRSTRRCSASLERQIRRYLAVNTAIAAIRNVASLLVDTRDMAVKAWVGSADYWNDVDRRAGERRAGETIAGVDAEAVHLRARARSGRPASADDAARFADVVRSVHAGELRRPLLRTDQRRGRADPQPQRSGGVGRDAIEAAEPVSVPAERRCRADCVRSRSTVWRLRSAAAK